MDEQLKRRLVGASVLVALAVIFVPMLLEHRPADLEPAPVAPLPPEPPRAFDSGLLPAEAVAPSASAPASVRPEPVVAPRAAPSQARHRPEAGAESSPAPRSQPASASKVPSKPKPKLEPPPKSPASPTAWVVQVASLENRDNALKLVKKLRGAGLDTMDPRPVTVKGKRYYRILVGPEASRKNAEAHQALIRKIAGTPGRVVRYP